MISGWRPRHRWAALEGCIRSSGGSRLHAGAGGSEQRAPAVTLHRQCLVTCTTLRHMRVVPVSALSVCFFTRAACHPLQEIKELTIRGLEGEVQRLVERHRAELQQAREQAQQQVSFCSHLHSTAMLQASSKWPCAVCRAAQHLMLFRSACVLHSASISQLATPVTCAHQPPAPLPCRLGTSWPRPSSSTSTS